MNAMSSNSDNKLLVITSLTGTDEKTVLEQTEKLQPPVPSQGSPDYQTFLKNFINSPANVISTIANFLRIQTGWKITSVENYQSYLNSFDNAPFAAGFSGSDLHYKTEYHSVSSLVSGIYTMANVPQKKQEEEYGLNKFFEEDFEKTTKNLTIITQNLQATEGQLILLFTKCDFIISYFPPQRTGINRQPKYKLSAEAAIGTLTIVGPSYFQQNGGQFLGLGFINVTNWINETSTPTLF